MHGHYRNSDDKKARITIIVPIAVDEQLRRLAAQRDTGVTPIVRDWIVEKLRQVGNEGVADLTEPSTMSTRS